MKITALVMALSAMTLLCAQESCLPPSISMPEFGAALQAKDAGNDSAAIAQMESLLIKFSGSPAPYYILGNWYWETGAREKAQKAWIEARTASPT